MKTVTLTLDLNKGNLILKALAKLPYEESAQLIFEIQSQMQEQLKPKEQEKKEDETK